MMNRSKAIAAIAAIIVEAAVKTLESQQEALAALLAEHIERQGLSRHWQELESAVRECEAHKEGKAIATVVSARPVSVQAQSAIKDHAQVLLGSSLECSYTTDPSLIGGVRVVTCDHMVFASVADALQRLERPLSPLV